MSVRPIPITLRPNEAHFLSDLANLFRRHKVRCGDPKDLEHLPSELDSNPRLCQDLFLLCTAISHMSETDLLPEELVDLIIRAVGGPRIPDTLPAAQLAASTRAVFVERYTAWLSRTTQQPPPASLDEDTWQAPEDPFVRAAKLSRRANPPDNASGLHAAARKLSPETAIGDLTLRELSQYLIELEQRVKRAEAYLGPVQASAQPTPAPHDAAEVTPAVLPQIHADEPIQLSAGLAEPAHGGIEDAAPAIEAAPPRPLEDEVPESQPEVPADKYGVPVSEYSVPTSEKTPPEEKALVYVDKAPAYASRVPLYEERGAEYINKGQPSELEVPALEEKAALSEEIVHHPQQLPGRVDKVPADREYAELTPAEELIDPRPAVEPALMDRVPYSRRVVQTSATAASFSVASEPLPTRSRTILQDEPASPSRNRISKPTAAVFALAVLGGAAVGYRFMVQPTPDRTAKTTLPDTRDNNGAAQNPYSDQRPASNSPTQVLQPLGPVPNGVTRPATASTPGANAAGKPQAGPGSSTAPTPLISVTPQPTFAPPASSAPLQTLPTMSAAPALPDVVPAPITRVQPSGPTPGAATRQVIEPYTQRMNSDSSVDSASRPAVETAANAPRADIPKPSAATPAPTAANHAGATVVSVPSSMLMKSALSIPAPRYPVGRHVNIDTSVVVRATISRDGRVISAKAVSGADDLRAAAQDAMLQWRFRPYLVDGTPVEVVTAVTFMFKAH